MVDKRSKVDEGSAPDDQGTAVEVVDVRRDRRDTTQSAVDEKGGAEETPYNIGPVLVLP